MSRVSGAEEEEEEEAENEEEEEEEEVVVVEEEVSRTRVASISAMISSAAASMTSASADPRPVSNLVTKSVWRANSLSAEFVSVLFAARSTRYRSERRALLASRARTKRETLVGDNTGNAGKASDGFISSRHVSAAARATLAVCGGGWSRRRRKKFRTRASVPEGTRESTKGGIPEVGTSPICAAVER
jgi:hypothetical protein